MSNLSFPTFSAHSKFSDPAHHQRAIQALPKDLQSLMQTIQGLLIHSDMLFLYGLNERDFTPQSRQTLSVAKRLDQILAVQDSPLHVQRTPLKRAVSTCRDYALLTVSFLREKSIPARMRCGFAKYFNTDHYEDHWICEYFHPLEKRWCFADCQLDEQHQAHLEIAFNPSELPSGEFVTAAQAWQMYRKNGISPDIFGHGNIDGHWFMSVNLARDFLVLNTIETSRWDHWREAFINDKVLSTEDLSYWDQIAGNTLDFDAKPSNSTLSLLKNCPY